MARTTPTIATLMSPIDGYLVDGGSRAVGYFEHMIETNQTAGTYTKGIQVKVTLSANTTYAIPVNIGWSCSGTPTIEAVYGIFEYMGAIPAGVTVNNFYAQSIVLDNTVTAGYMGFWRIYTAGTGTVDSVFHLANSGGTPITNLIDFEGQVAPVSAGSDSTSCDLKVACLVGASTRYIHLFSD